MNTEMLEVLWRSWAERGAALTAEQWATPTRLPGWSVRALFAHVAPDVAEMDTMRDRRAEGPAMVSTGAEILRVFNSPGGLAHTAADDIAEQAAGAAETIETETLLRRFAEDGPRALAELGDLRPDTVLPHPHLGTVTCLALVEVAIVDLTVHLLDLIAAVGGPPVPEPALRYTAQILAAVPDPIEFIEAATGRGTVAVLPVMR
ncbi:maleylpyruvate isomerase N-terminal domain-containing protein [Nocardia iowensis]|uniref:Maleylpyruvate isomerase N-terminal domain-containing protein n=1 Tax=Nocardia iowensis TaxID=204891 RepID=A0ABX8RVP2_NOCIO|nr:maleylpyruvate isomerase N-terminal domain-containing protein [Nocardia iowensis]QXN92420.1 maleylpyruvate isomerase N-terminal domain-containing protein [Nocardia iowensis]